MQRTLRYSGLALLFLTIGIGASRAAPPSTESKTGAPAFTYYVMSLYWLPTLCRESPRADECNGTLHGGFVVHGLWPVRDVGSPINCGGNDRVADDVVKHMADLMPTRRLVEQEWALHGSCTGLSPDQFFRMLRQAYASINIPPLGNTGSPTQAKFFEVTKAFTRRDPGLPAQAVAVTCSNENPAMLREVHICLSTNLASRYCSGEIIGSACRTLEVTLPPIR